MAPAPQVQIAARIDPVGALTPGLTGIVGFTVDNRGSGPAGQVTAHVTVPAGVSLLAAGTLGRASMDRASPGGWTCAPTASGATCTHGPLAADASTTSYLQVLVAAAAPLDLGFRGPARVAVHQAFADVTGLVAQFGSGTWSATAPVPRG